MKTLCFVALVAVGCALAGCGNTESKAAPVNLVAAKPTPLKFPAECTRMDSPACEKHPETPGCTHTWIPLPEGDLYTDDILRRDDQLSDRFEDTQAERRICAAAVNKASRK